MKNTFNLFYITSLFLLLFALSITVVIATSSKVSLRLDAYLWYAIWGVKTITLLLYIKTHASSKKLLFYFISYLLLTIAGLIIIAYQYSEGKILVYLSMILVILFIKQCGFGLNKNLFFTLFMSFEFLISFLKILYDLSTPLYLNTISLLLLIPVLTYLKLEKSKPIKP